MNAIGQEFFFSSTRAGLFWFDDISYIQNSCVLTYYSQGSGNVTDPIWDIVPVGTGTIAAFDQAKSMVVQNGHSVTQDVPSISLTDFMLDAGGSYVPTAPSNVMRLIGNAEVNDNNFGPLVMEWDAWMATNSVSGGDIELTSGISNGGGVDFTANSLSIIDELAINEGGTFDLNGNGLILVSEANGTGRIADLSNGILANASNTTMQRYIPAGVTNWRSIGSPIAGQTLQDLDDDFFTAGFTGSDYPLFYTNNDPMQPLWPSIRGYDETNAGALILDGLEGPADVTVPMGVGEGFVAWSGDNFVSTNEFTIDFTGTPNTGFINIPMDYTSTGDIAVDGWNLVSNPLPSPINFGSMILGADVEDVYYVYDPIAGNNAAWNETLGISIPSGSLNGNIQSSQGFWLHAIGPSNNAAVTESAKVSEPLAGGLFGGSQTQNIDMLRLEISSGMNSYFDEAVIAFHAGTSSFESSDMKKFIFNNGVSPQIATESADGVTMALNDWGAFSTDISIPVQVDVPISGTYTITAFDAQSVLGMTCLVLEDMITGTTTTISEGVTYSFYADANTAASPARFVLHASAPAELATTEVLCAGGATGEATITNPTSTVWNVEWIDQNGSIIQTQTVANGTVSITGLTAGEYTVNVSGGCGNLTNEFIIDEPGNLAAMSSVLDATCSSVNDGSIDLTPMGGVAPHTYLWSNGSTDEDQLNIGSGMYDVLVTDANGCEFEETGIIVSADDNPVAVASASSLQVLVGEVIQFTNQSTGAISQEWDMGDGTIYPDFEVSHAYALPGNYVVTLVVDLFGCQSVTTIDIEVSTSTSVQETDASSISAFMQGENMVITWTEAGYTGQLYNLTGAVVGERMQFNGSNGTAVIGMHGKARGVYLLNLTNGADVRTIRVPLFR
jgi:hypothetical protein